MTHCNSDTISFQTHKPTIPKLIYLFPVNKFKKQFMHIRDGVIKYDISHIW